MFFNLPKPEATDPIEVTLLIGNVREPVPTLGTLNPYKYFDQLINSFKEVARFIFSMRPEATAVEFAYQGMVITLTPTLAQEKEKESEGYKDSLGY